MHIIISLGILGLWAVFVIWIFGFYTNDIFSLMMDGASIFVAGASLFISYWVFINSESIKSYVKQVNDKKFAKEDCKKYRIDIETLKDMAENKKDIELIRAKAMTFIGLIEIHEKCFNKKGKKALKSLVDDKFYDNKNYSKIIYNLSLVLSNLNSIDREGNHSDTN